MTHHLLWLPVVWQLSSLMTFHAVLLNTLNAQEEAVTNKINGISKKTFCPIYLWSVTVPYSWNPIDLKATIMPTLVLTLVLHLSDFSSLISSSFSRSCSLAWLSSFTIVAKSYKKIECWQGYKKCLKIVPTIAVISSSGLRDWRPYFQRALISFFGIWHQ